MKKTVWLVILAFGVCHPAFCEQQVQTQQAEKTLPQYGRTSWQKPNVSVSSAVSAAKPVARPEEMNVTTLQTLPNGASVAGQSTVVDTKTITYSSGSTYHSYSAVFDIRTGVITTRLSNKGGTTVTTVSPKDTAYKPSVAKMITDIQGQIAAEKDPVKTARLQTVVDYLKTVEPKQSAVAYKWGKIKDMSVTSYQKLANGATVASRSVKVSGGNLTVAMGSTAGSASFRMDLQTGVVTKTLSNKAGTTVQTIRANQSAAYIQAVKSMQTILKQQLSTEMKARNKADVVRVYLYLRRIAAKLS